MKLRIFGVLLLAMCLTPLTAQNLRVINNRVIGTGFYPQLSADASELIYLENEHLGYESDYSQSTYVTNEDLNVVLYRNGQRKVLNPRGNDVNYVWSSISPDGKKILFNTKYGTEVCDLNGRIIASLGKVYAPVWYGNDRVVGHHSTSDGHFYTSSCIVMATLDGKPFLQLTDPREFGMFPSVSPLAGKIAYNTLDGEMHLMQINLAEQPINNQLPAVRLAPAAMRIAQTPGRHARKQNFSDLKIYINPGHGGHTGNDRPMHIYPFAQNDPESFWESNSNLDKGLRLRDLLNAMGCQTKMSRIYNEEEDDLDLSVIVAQANTYNADFMLSIHSNAGNPSNFILQLYAGRDPGDNTIYSDMGQASDESRAITTLMGSILYENQVSDWTAAPRISGDKTFARTIMGWSNGYGVLRNLRVPGTISEGCMHDYIPETYRLMNMDYKWRESFYFLRTFMEYYFDYTIPTGAIGGQVRDAYLPMTFPAISYHHNSIDGMKPINRATVKLYQGESLLQTYTTDTLYNGCYFFWDLNPGEYRVVVEADGYYPMEYMETVTAAHISYHNSLINMSRNTPLEVTSHVPAPASITDSVNVSSPIILNFNWDCLPDSTIAAFSISPNVEGEMRIEDNNHTLRFIPSGRLEPGTEYTVTLTTKACHPDNQYPNHLAAPFQLRFRTLNRGAIRYMQSYPANGETNVPTNPSIIMVFDQTLVPSSARNSFSVAAVGGAAVPVNTRSFEYNKAPSPYGYAAFELTSALQPNTEYEITVSPDLKDNIGVKLTEPLTLRFTTGSTNMPALPMLTAMDTLVFAYDAEHSFGVSSATTFRNTNKKYTGQASNELSYVFSDEQAEALYRPLNPMLISARRGAKMGMYVFSDFSGNELYARFETAGDIQYVKICDLDYGGWKWQEISMDELPEGVDFQLMALRVVRSSSILSGSGKIYLNNLSFRQGVEETALDDAEASEMVTKIVENGHVYIIRDGRRYTILGTEAE